MSEYEKHQRVRRLLKNAWNPFFAGFGRLTEIQLETIPHIIKGTNVVVSAPTASGKTEAVVAPVAELLVRERWPSLSVLYIIPTRALGNDMCARLENSLLGMGITVRLKHGDRPYVPEKKNLPNFLITTPESLDSMLCRRTEVLEDVRTVILDELHLLDYTYRGDQLRILLRRLKGVVSDTDFSVHILSATLSKPEKVAQRYGTGFTVVKAQGQRTMDLTIVRSFDEVLDLSRVRGFKKILCFCNKREEVESVASKLSELWAPYPVVAHHGSLGASVRKEAERVMKESPVAVCVATSTLEIGIDIGDIDLVLLAEIPWSLSSFVQRIGRGKRRANIINVAALVATEGEMAFVEGMAREVEEGRIEPESYHPDVSVAVQQIFSYLYQHKSGASEEEILALISPLCDKAEGLMILDHLLKTDWIEFRSGKWSASTKLMDRGERGNIHSNIPSPEMLSVYDVDMGNEIGQISKSCAEAFVLGHRRWKVVGRDEKSVKVRRLKGEAGPAKFKSSREEGAYEFFLPKELRSISDQL
ncbi:DEAD/DEAH box helicase [Thermodesulfobacteriota bacterium]